jgi:hypothetical protein
VASFFLIAGAVLWAILSPGYQHGGEMRRRSACANNLKKLHSAFVSFSIESRGGLYPELSGEGGRLMMAFGGPSDSKGIYPDYLTELSLLLCPSEEEARSRSFFGGTDGPETSLDDRSYFYLGYVVMDDEDVAAFAEAYKARIEERLGFAEGLRVESGLGTWGGDVIERLRAFRLPEVRREGHDRMEQLLSELSKIPLLIERHGNHPPSGGHVLYMDGRVEFIRYPGKWPMTETTVGLLQDIDGL